MTSALIALGSNIGESRSLLVTAVHEIDALPATSVTAVSRLYSTAPMGVEDQPDFLNAAALVETELSPSELLDALHHIENVHGRTRDVRWGPRTLDLDVIDIEGFSSDSAELTVPHPRATERQFVIQPVADIAPQWVFSGNTVESLVEPSSDVVACDSGDWSGL